MNLLPLKPLSVNQAWRGGRRFRTKEYLQYERDLFALLPKRKEKLSGKLRLIVEVGLSNPRQDLDGIFKCLIDVLCKKYAFNDNQIFEINAGKTITKKGKEFISFSLEKLWIF